MTMRRNAITISYMKVRLSKSLIINKIVYFLMNEKAFCFIKPFSVLSSPRQYIAIMTNNNIAILFSSIDRYIFFSANVVVRSIVIGAVKHKIIPIGIITLFRYICIDIPSSSLATNNLTICANTYIIIRANMVDHAGVPILRIR